MDKWLHRVEENTFDTAVVTVVGNKSDCGKRVVSEEEVNEFVQRNEGILYFECSAKANEGILQVLLKFKPDI